MNAPFNVGIPIILSPMAGVTDITFRMLCRELGCTHTVTEMVSAKGYMLNPKPTENVRALYQIKPESGSVGIQIFGSEPEMMADAAAELAESGCAYIDINMGCPMPKIVGNGEGSALMRTPHLAEEIVRRVVRAVRLPVTVKIRTGWDEHSINAVEFAQRLEQVGAAAIAVHARTRAQMYQGRADWDMIARVKRALAIPVFGNGDIFTAQDALAMLTTTGCDGVLVGRGAQGNPFLFAQIRAALGGDPAPEPTPRTRLDIIRRHADMLAAWRGADVAVREMRKHIAWYLHGLRGSAGVRHDILSIDDPAEVDARLEAYIESLESEQAGA